MSEKPRFTTRLQWVNPHTGQMTSEAQRILSALIEGLWTRSGLLTSDLITGTAGTDGQLAKWNSDGDLVAQAAASGLLTFFATPSSANLRSLVTDEVGTGSLVFDETGTFTPTFSFATVGTSTWSFSSQIGRYVKLSNRVYIFARVTGTPTIGTGTGNLQMNGLPFASTSPSIPVLAVGVLGSAFTWTAGRTQVAATVGNSASLITFIQFGSAVTAASIQASNMTSGSAHNIDVTGFYETT